MENPNNMKEIVLFDVDDTIIKGQSQKLFLDFLFKNNYVSIAYFLRLSLWFIFYKIGLIKNPKSAMQYAFSFTKNRTELDIAGIVEKFFNSTLVYKIYPEAKKIIKEHRDKGRSVLLVSNAVDVLIRKIASYLEADDFISTKLEIIDGVYTGNINGNIMYGEIKKQSVEHYIKSKGFTLDNSWAYGDHMSDIFLLSIVKNPYVINPSKELKGYATNKNWPIIYFKT